MAKIPIQQQLLLTAFGEIKGNHCMKNGQDSRNIRFIKFLLRYDAI